MKTIKPLEIKNDTAMVALTRYGFEYCIRQSTLHTWLPVKVDAHAAKQALRLIADAPKTMAFRQKLQVRSGAIEVLITKACPVESADPMFILKFKSALMR